MNCRYELLERDGQQIDALTEDEHGLRIEVNRHGAELISLARRAADGKWQGFLYRDGLAAAPASGWKNHATVMGYYVHRLKGEQTTCRGQVIKGGTHSFLRHKDFAAPAFDAAAASLTFTILPGQIEPGEYPLQVRLDLTYALVLTKDSSELQVTFDFTNLEQQTSAPVSFGLHPGFGVTSLDEARVTLPAGKYTRHLAPDNFLSGEMVEIDHPGGLMPFNKAELPGSFLLELAGVPERTFTVADPPTGRRIDLDYQEAPYVTLWSDGGPFICVEPCWGLPDHHEQRPFEEKLGIQEIEPGGTLRVSFTMNPMLGN